MQTCLSMTARGIMNESGNHICELSFFPFDIRSIAENIPGGYHENS